MFSCLLSLCVRKKRLENIEYDRKYFETDYDLLNPSTKLEAFKQYEEHINLQE